VKVYNGVETLLHSNVTAVLKISLQD